MKKRIVLPAIGTAVVGAAAGVFLGFLYQYIFYRDRGPLLNLLESKTHSEKYYERRDRKADELRQTRGFTLSSESPDGLKLLGFYYPRGTQLSKKIAFVIHGYHSEHLETTGMVFEYWHNRGFDVFCPDHRAHGQSEGTLVCYDTRESEDCLRWIDILRENFGEDVQIVLQGFSMGGATVLKMSDKVPENVKFIISDSGYTSARELIENNIGPLTHLMSRANKVISGYELEDTDVRDSVRNTKVPILFVHGTDDPTVPFWMGKELYELCPEPKDCLFVEDARHIEAAHNAPVDYAKKTDKFIDRFVHN